MSAEASERFSAIQSEIYHHGYDRGYKQGRADAIESAYYVIKPFMSIEEWKSEVNYQIGLKENK